MTRLHAGCLIICLLGFGGTHEVRAQQRDAAPDRYLQKTRAFYTAAEFERATGGRVHIQRTLDPAAAAALQKTFIALPSIRLTVIQAAASATWVGTEDGAIRLGADGRSVEYFAGQRWLPDDHVTG
ncbi:MAG: hypothetical protein ABJC51_02990, partial [Acidobacteriota bacterium]